MKLVIVESPAKAKTINKYLGDSYKVLASYGHIRDLPKKDGAVDTENDFSMQWEISSDAHKRIKEISDATQGAEKLILATDPDREGEAISWHICETLRTKGALKTDCVVERVVFNAITKSTVTKALEEPRNIDAGLVDSYRARVALDYLVGFKLSPVLWRKLPGSQSAGRVQSVALRVVCEREHEIGVFIPQEYWQVQANLRAPCDTKFEAKLYSLDGAVLKKFTLDNEETAHSALEVVRKSSFSVHNVESKPFKRRPAPPFITSTLQQEASRKLGFNAKQTMKAAQSLYEDGKITYMRTDGVSMAEEAYKSVRNQIESQYGTNYLPEKTIRYTSKQKNAQEAHEAIRPTSFRLHPKDLEIKDKDAFILYSLIWKRAVASQMRPAEYERTTADMISQDERAVLRATGQVSVFDGFTRVYTEGKDKDESSDEDDDQDRKLPKLNVGDSTSLDRVDGAEKSQHQTKPPPRYTEASLVKKLEELGIGRPSTYASTMSKLVDRDYVRNEEKQLRPENRGLLVTAFLENFLGQYVEYDFTANLENELDTISDGKLNWKSFLNGFWADFKKHIDGSMNLDPSTITDTLDSKLSGYFFPTHRKDGSPIENPRKCPKCNKGKLVLITRNGGFVGCSDYPSCDFTSNRSPFSGDVAVREGTIGTHDETGEEVVLKVGRYGPYVEMKVPNAEKPKRMSIPKEWSIETLSLAQACNLLSLPREIGKDQEDNEPITASLGRYGPYVQHQRTFANLKSVNDLFEIDLERAAALIKEKRSNQFTRGQRNVEVLIDLGPHPETKEPLQVLNGRYGPYVKSGKINASLPKDMDPGEVSADFAVELINKRAANPVKRGKGKTTRRSTSRRSSKK